jgi:hypothetical protein
VATAAAVSCVAFLWFVSSRPCDFRGDDFQYALQIANAVDDRVSFHPAGIRLLDPATGNAESGGTPLPWPINPRYILDWPTSAGFVRLARGLGATADILHLVALTRMIAGALTLGVMFLALVVATGDRGLAAMCIAGLGSSLVFWSYATHVDQSMSSALMIALAFLALAASVRGGPPQAGLLVALAVASAVGVLYNLTVVLSVMVFAATATWHWFLHGHAHAGRDVRGGGRASRLATWATLLGCAALLGFAISGRLGETLFLGRPEYQVSPSDIPKALIGFAKSQVSLPGMGESFRDYWATQGPPQRLAAAGLYGLFLAGWVALFCLAWLVRAVPHRTSTLLACTTAWFGLTSLFALFWDPGFVKYWLVPMLAGWSLAALVVSRTSSLGGPWRLALRLAVSAVVAAQVALNTVAVVRPAATCPSPWRACAEAARATWPRTSLVLTPGHRADFSLVYFADLNVLAPRLIHYAGASLEETGARVATHVERHLAAGGPIYVLPDEPHGAVTDDPWGLIERVPVLGSRTLPCLVADEVEGPPLLEALRRTPAP